MGYVCLFVYYLTHAFRWKVKERRLPKEKQDNRKGGKVVEGSLICIYFNLSIVVVLTCL